MTRVTARLAIGEFSVGATKRYPSAFGDTGTPGWRLFNYKAIDANGKAILGQIDALNIVDLELRLKRMGLDLIVGGPHEARRRASGARSSAPELINFCFHLEQLTGAGRAARRRAHRPARQRREPALPRSHLRADRKHPGRTEPVGRAGQLSGGVQPGVPRA